MARLVAYSLRIMLTYKISQIDFHELLVYRVLKRSIGLTRMCRGRILIDGNEVCMPAF